ncbi:MAG: vitamin B12 dependent-methionine synthase activation domain-containing protein [Bacillota bacterium]|nr:vitamin B12 dependent-methionine synthase activation domain-containing protein [Bacillota bacterium]
MEYHLLEHITFKPDSETFFAEMRLSADSPRHAACRRLLDEAATLARPRAIWLQADIKQLDGSGMTLGGQRFHSSLFSRQFQPGQTVYPFLASCGPEIDAWQESYRGELLRQFWADAIAEKALRTAVAALEDKITKLVENRYLASYNPGSLPVWPLEEQKPLFALFGKAAEEVGVQLTEYCMMRPQKSVSGIYFSSPAEYNNCQFCPRLRCPSRKAEFSGACC